VTHRPTERRIVVAGDWHGVLPWTPWAIRRTAANKIRTIVHVGDLGIGPWFGRHDDFVGRLDTVLARHDVRLLVVPGNHENYDTLVAAPRDETGAMLLGEHIRALPRGYRWQIAEVRFGALGGATSVDRDQRIPGSSWWAAEAISLDDVDQLGDEPLDVLVTHEAPAEVLLVSPMSVPDDLRRVAQYGRQLVRMAVEHTGPRVAFRGHWHSAGPTRSRATTAA
jgi:Icc-related predicted phosphoesterase